MKKRTWAWRTFSSGTVPSVDVCAVGDGVRCQCVRVCTAMCLLVGGFLRRILQVYLFSEFIVNKTSPYNTHTHMLHVAATINISFKCIMWRRHVALIRVSSSIQRIRPTTGQPTPPNDAYFVFRKPMEKYIFHLLWESNSIFLNQIHINSTVCLFWLHISSVIVPWGRW